MHILESLGSIEYCYVFDFPITWGALPYRGFQAHRVAPLFRNDASVVVASVVKSRYEKVSTVDGFALHKFPPASDATVQSKKF